MWSARAVARICGRLQFHIKRDRGRGAHVVARLEPGCQTGVTQFCCRQGKIAEEGAVFQGVKKMASAYKFPPAYKACFHLHECISTCMSVRFAREMESHTHVP